MRWSFVRRIVYWFSFSSSEFSPFFGESPEQGLRGKWTFWSESKKYGCKKYLIGGDQKYAMHLTMPNNLYLDVTLLINYTPAQRSWRGGIWIHLVCLSVCPSVRLSVCRRHGFRSISQVCFGISISNFICMLMVAIGRSLLIFSDVAFKMAAWRPYWIFWFPDSNFTLALNVNFKLKWHNTYVYV